MSLDDFLKAKGFRLAGICWVKGTTTVLVEGDNILVRKCTNGKFTLSKSSESEMKQRFYNALEI